MIMNYGMSNKQYYFCCSILYVYDLIALECDDSNIFFVSMQPAIKLQLNHYNSIPTFALETNTPKIEHRLKEEHFQLKAERRIEGTPHPLDDHYQEEVAQISNSQIKKEGEEDPMEELYKDLIDSASWECPCGKKVQGPIQYFQHVKQSHQYDSLQQLVQQRTLRKVIDLYPNVCKEEIEIIEELDAGDIPQMVRQLASKHEAALRSREVPLLEGGGLGTFGDMAGRFVDQCKQNSLSVLLMRLFFAFLRQFVGVEMGPNGWSQQSPGQLLRYSNQLVAFFQINSLSAKYQPLRSEDIKRLVYVLAKWMFDKRWTNDRIFLAIEPEQQSTEMEKKEEEEQHSNDVTAK